MPRTVFDESQNKIEVPDEAEIKALQEKAKQADDLAAKLKEQEDLNKDPETVNWRAARQKIKAAEKVIEEARKSMDPNANKAAEPAAPAAAPAAPDVNEVVNKQLAEERIADELGKFNEKDRAVIKSYFDRLCPPGTPARLDKAAVQQALIDSRKMVLPPQREDSSARSMAASAGMHGAPPPSVGEDSPEEQLTRGSEIAKAIGYQFKSKRFSK